MDRKYKKKENDSGANGVDYQINLLALIALNGLNINEGWQLSTENSLAGKFEDIVIKSESGEFLIQCKHKKKESSIAWDNLFNKKGKDKNDFYLPKYLDSFEEIKKNKFDTKLLIICSNIGLDDTISEKESISIPLLSKEMICYKLRDSATIYMKETLAGSEEFCEKLRFVLIKDSELHTSINDKLVEAENYFGLKFEKLNFIANIKQWFLDKNGIFMTKSHVTAFLYEWRSQSYSKEMISLEVYFERSYFIRKSIKVVNIVSVIDNFLNILMILRNLPEDMRKVLIIKPGEVSEKIMKSFELPRLSILIITLNDVNMYSEIHPQIKQILDEYSYKKVIIISQQPIQTHFPRTDVIEDEIKFTDLTKACQNALLSKDVKFQGNLLPVKRIIGDSTDYNSIIDQTTIIDLIQDNVIEISTSNENLGEIPKYYIDRIITENYESKEFEEFDLDMGGISKRIDRMMEKYDHKKYNENYELKEFEEKDIRKFVDGTDKVVLISDVAGMGKTTYLTKLGILIKQEYPHLFLIRIDLNNFTRIFELKKHQKESIQLEEILEFEDKNYFKNNFKRNIFSIPKKCILLIDAVDEISPEYTDLIKDFLVKNSTRGNIAKLILTTRSHLTKDLESLLYTRSYRLLPYSKPQQIDFLKKFWMNSNMNKDMHDFENHAKTIIETLEVSIGYISWNFVGIPLQTKMIAEIFQMSDQKKSMDFLKDLNITRLYDMFVAKKRTIFIDEKCMADGKPFVIKSLSSEFQEAIREHMKLAAKLLFSGEKFSFGEIFQDDIKSPEEMIKMGMLQMMGDEVTFIHRTFADYFAAKTLWEMLTKKEIPEDFIISLIFSIFASKQYETVRAFLENILIDVWNDIPEEMLIFWGSVTDSIANDEYTYFDTLAKEGRVHIFKLMLENSGAAGKLVDSNKQLTHRMPDADYHKKDHQLFSRYWDHFKDDETYCNRTRKEISKAIFNAAEWGNFELMKFCMDKGADLELEDIRGRTVIFYAVSRGHVELVKYLVDKGVDLNRKDRGGQTVIFNAVLGGHLELVKYFVGIGVDLNREDKKGRTVIFYAALKGYVDLVEYLVDEGADLNRRDTEGGTIIFYAAFTGHLELIKYFADKEVDLNQKNIFGETAIFAAAHYGHFELVKYFLDEGADLNQKNTDGDTVICQAALEGHMELVKYFVDRGADLNQRYGEGKPLILYATESGNLELVKYFVEKGADLSQADANGRTAFSIATEYGHSELIEYFINIGTNLNGDPNREEIEN